MALRMSPQTLILMALLLAEPEAEWYGFDLAQRARLKTGTLYPIWARLEEAGWLRSHWEDVDPRKEGRPRRRLYVLTAHGEAEARRILEEHRQRVMPGKRPTRRQP